MRSLSRLFKAGIVSLRDPLPLPLTHMPEPVEEADGDAAAGEARALLESARAQAEEIRRQAAQAARELYAQAREEGVAEGRRLESAPAARAAQEDLRRETAREQEQLRGLAEELENRLAQTRHDVRQEALTIGCALAGHMLRAEIDRGAPQFSGLAERIFPQEDESGNGAGGIRPAGHEAARVRNGGGAVA